MPFLVAGISLYGLVADPDNVERLLDRLGPAIPDAVSELIRTQLSAIVSSARSSLGLGAAVGLGAGLWAASNGVAHLVEALNIAYDEGTDDRTFVQRRSLALGLTVVILADLAVTVTIISWTSARGGATGHVMVVGAWLVAVIGFASVLAVLYRFGADRSEPDWAWASPGAAVAAVAWISASLLFACYGQQHRFVQRDVRGARCRRRGVALVGRVGDRHHRRSPGQRRDRTTVTSRRDDRSG